MSGTAVTAARRWWQRGDANHGWLKTFHTFSFASYYDPSMMSFGPLRVINEDRVAPSTGFPTHPHANAEIFSYIINGELTHKDSMGNVETLRRGEVQFTSAGKGIRHSEYNDNAKEEVHFLQIWYTPYTRNLPPKYYTIPQVPDSDKTDKFMTLIRDVKTFTSEEQEKIGLLPQGRAIPAYANLTTRVSILTPGNKVIHQLGHETTQTVGERWVYLHVAMTSGWRDPAAFDKQLRRDLVGYAGHDERLAHAARFIHSTYGVLPPWSRGDPGRCRLQAVSKSKPHVTLTYAQSRDVKIAGANKKMLALSNAESMVMTHALRTIHDGILVGAGTLVNDNPQLNARLLNPLPDGTQVPLDMCPQPIVLDAKLQTPLDCKLLGNAQAGTGKAPIIVTAASAPEDKLSALREAGAKILQIQSDAQGRLAWSEVFASLKAECGLQSVMVEGGASVIEGLFEAQNTMPLLDHVVVTVAPKRVGQDGYGYNPPSWLGQRLSEGMAPSKQHSPGIDSTKSAPGTTLHPVHLDPIFFQKDLIFSWASSAAMQPLQASKEARICVNGTTYLAEGDGAFVRRGLVGDSIKVENIGRKNAEFILFDVEPSEEDDGEDEEDD